MARHKLISLSEAVRLRHAAWLERVRPAVSAEVLAQLRERGAAAHRGLFAAARRVPCHRDFTPGNWLVSGPLLEGQMLALDGFYVVDFEHAHLDCPLFDIVKLQTLAVLVMVVFAPSIFDKLGISGLYLPLFYVDAVAASLQTSVRGFQT